ncbi:MAG: hypothetical protein KDI17_17110 [Halioglobus sp.]|nr:hypothetical protein [Halioglobus sp.]
MAGNRAATLASETVFHIHLMKTAGTTVNSSLRDFYPPALRYVQAEQVAEAIRMKTSPELLLGLPAERRAALRFINAHMPLTVARRYREATDTRVVITLLLRDGLDRAVSNLRHLARQLDFTYSYRELLDDPVLGGFFLTNHQTRALGMSGSDAQWDEWQRCFGCLLYLRMYMKSPDARFPVSAVDGADLQRAVAALADIDVLGLQSGFDAWWRSCHARLGWPAVHHPPVNVGAEKARVVAPKIPADVMDELRDRNKLDAQLYAAAAELLSAPAPASAQVQKNRFARVIEKIVRR